MNGYRKGVRAPVWDGPARQWICRGRPDDHEEFMGDK